VAACEFHERAFVWHDQLEPGGPCYEVDLTDGLSEENTQELHDTFTCLNQEGNLDPLRELDEVMDTWTRANEPAGVELAVLLNDLPAAGIDPFEVAGDLVEWMENPEGREAVDIFWEAIVELLYGVPYATVTEEGFPLRTAESLDAGLVRPLLPAIRSGAAAVLDDDMKALELMTSMVESEALLSLLHTTAAWAEEPSLEGVVADLPRKLGAAIDASRTPANDRWPDASGDSVRDLVEALLVDEEEDGRIVLAHLDEELIEVVENDRVRDELETTLGSLQASGALANFPVELLHLTAVDAQGGSLSEGEDSALVALMRLLRRGDQPMRCALSLLGWEIGAIEVDNLSQEVLTMIAELEPGAAVDTVDLLGGALDLEILGFQLTDYLLGEIASGGLCTNPGTGAVVIDALYVSDLESIDRLNDAQAGEALRTTVHLLAAVHDDADSELPALVSFISEADGFGLTEPLEEALRDFGDSALIRNAVDLLPALLSPADYADDHDYPEGVEPVDFDAAWDMLRAAMTLSDEGRTPIEDLARPFAAIAAEEETWLAIGNLAVMLQDPAQHLNSPGSYLVPLLDLDPELELTRALGGVVLRPHAGGPLLRIAEHQEVIDAIGRAGEEEEGPLPFVGRLITQGTLATLLRTIDRVLIAL